MFKKKSRKASDYSQKELEKLCKAFDFDKDQVLFYIETKGREVIHSTLRLYDANSKTVNSSPNTIQTVFYLKPKEHLNWDFLQQTANLIDIRDKIIYYDTSKMINKLHIKTKNKTTAEIYKIFGKASEKREKKLYKLFDAPEKVEKHDLSFLVRNQSYLQKPSNAKDLKFFSCFTKLNKFERKRCFEFIDLFSLGKLAQVNKYFCSAVSSRKEDLFRIYCQAIFRRSELYQNKKEKLSSFKNFESMFVNRPRVRFEGIYYALVRFSSTGFKDGFGEPIALTNKYLRYMRFCPSGQVLFCSCAKSKSQKVIRELASTGANERVGRFNVDGNNVLTVTTYSFDKAEYVYRFKVDS